MALAGSIQLLAREETGPGFPARAGLQVGVQRERTRAEEDNTKPKTRQLHSTTGAGALSGRFWGMLLNLIVAEELGAGPIFLGAEGVSKLEHAFIGSVSEEALRHANRTVIVVGGHPDDGTPEGENPGVRR